MPIIGSPSKGIFIYNQACRSSKKQFCIKKKTLLFYGRVYCFASRNLIVCILNKKFKLKFKQATILTKFHSKYFYISQGRICTEKTIHFAEHWLCNFLLKVICITWSNKQLLYVRLFLKFLNIISDYMYSLPVKDLQVHSQQVHCKMLSSVESWGGKINAEYKNEMWDTYLIYSLQFSIMQVMKGNELWLRCFVVATATKQIQYSQML